MLFRNGIDLKELSSGELEVAVRQTEEEQGGAVESDQVDLQDEDEESRLNRMISGLAGKTKSRNSKVIERLNQQTQVKK